MVDLDLLVFKAVAERSSFSEAAKILHMTQPAVSFHIQALEDNLGVKLFQRRKGYVILTAAGTTLAGSVKKILKDYEEARRLVLMSTNMIKGSISLSSCPSFGEYVLPSIMGQFIKNFPNIKYTLNIETSENVMALLMQRATDIGFTDACVQSDMLIFTKLFEDELVLIVSKNKSKNTDIISLDEFLSYPLVLEVKTSPTRRELDEFIKKAAVNELNIVFEHKSIQVIKESVICGIGAAFLPKMTVMREVKSGLVKIIRVKDMSLYKSIYMATSKKKPLMPKDQEFIKFIKNHKFN